MANSTTGVRDNAGEAPSGGVQLSRGVTRHSMAVDHGRHKRPRRLDAGTNSTGLGGGGPPTLGATCGMASNGYSATDTTVHDCAGAPSDGAHQNSGNSAISHVVGDVLLLCDSPAADSRSTDRKRPLPDSFEPARKSSRAGYSDSPQHQGADRASSTAITPDGHA